MSSVVELEPRDIARNHRLSRLRQQLRPEHLRPTEGEVDHRRGSFFVQAFGQVWEAEISAGARYLYLALLQFANDEGFCWPSVAKLAERTEYSTNTVRKYITELSDRKVRLVAIHREKAEAAGAYHMANRYQLFLAGTRPSEDRWIRVLQPDESS